MHPTDDTGRDRSNLATPEFILELYRTRCNERLDFCGMAWPKESWVFVNDTLAWK